MITSIHLTSKSYTSWQTNGKREEAHHLGGVWANEQASNAEIRISVFCTPNEVMYLGDNHHWLKILQKRQPFIVCHLKKVNTTTYKACLIKKIKPWSSL